MWWTFAAAGIGSLTALFVACIVYPWQKSIDRRNELAREKRICIQDLVRLVANYEKLTKSPEEADLGLTMHAAILLAYGEDRLSEATLNFSEASMRRIRASKDQESGLGDATKAEIRDKWIAAHKNMYDEIRNALKNDAYRHVSMLRWVKDQFGAAQ